MTKEKIVKKILVNKDYRKNYIESLFSNMETLVSDYKNGVYNSEEKIKDFLEFSLHEIIKDTEKIKEYTLKNEILESTIE